MVAARKTTGWHVFLVGNVELHQFSVLRRQSGTLQPLVRTPSMALFQSAFQPVSRQHSIRQLFSHMQFSQAKPEVIHPELVEKRSRSHTWYEEIKMPRRNSYISSPREQYSELCYGRLLADWLDFASSSPNRSRLSSHFPVNLGGY